MFGNFLMRKMLQSKMKDVPEEMQEKLFTAIEKNPEFFKKVAEEIQGKMKGGSRPDVCGYGSDRKSPRGVAGIDERR